MMPVNPRIVVFLSFLGVSTVAISATGDGRWHAGIGDPTIAGWLTVMIYFVAALCSFRVYRINKRTNNNPHFWFGLAIVLVLLGINKQLDLQSWFTQTMKDSAQAHGWYKQRRPLQVAFIVALGLGALIVLLTLRLYLVNSWRRYKMTWLGIVLLCTFVMMRAASFNHIDTYINTHFLGLRLNVWLEIGALSLIILGTFFHRPYVLLVADTTSVRNYVEIAREGDAVQCPNCGQSPLSKPMNGRLFKCRKCSHRYTVRLIA